MHKLTRERDIRAAFWREHPHFNRRKLIPNHAGNGKMYPVDVRCAFCDWLDYAHRDGRVSDRLVRYATLR